MYTPGYETENLTKPSITKTIEETDPGLTPEQAAVAMLKGKRRPLPPYTDPCGTETKTTVPPTFGTHWYRSGLGDPPHSSITLRLTERLRLPSSCRHHCFHLATCS
jgi:hypothetical protein